MRTTWPSPAWCSFSLLPALTIACILGAALAWYVPLVSLLPPALLLVCGLLAFPFFSKQPQAGAVLVFFLFLTLGWLHTSKSIQRSSTSGDLDFWIREKTTVRLTGTLTAMPEYNGHTSKLLIETDTLRLPDWHTFRQITGAVRLSLPGKTESLLTPGDRLLLRATLDIPRNFGTPGSFNHRLFLAARGLHVSGWIAAPGDLIRFRQTPRENGSLRYLPQQLRQKIAFFLDSRLEEQSAALYRALLLGDRSAIAPNILETFKNTGTMHILAISGLHMSLLGLLGGGLLYRLLRCSTRLMLTVHVWSLAALCCLPLLLFYAFISGLGSPALRALLMSCAVILALLTRRDHRLPHILSAAALLLCLAQPLALFTASFQLSFAAVLGIAMILPFLQRIWQVEEGTAEQNPPRTHLLIQVPVRFLFSALLVSLAANAATLPLLLYHFNRISLIGPLANLLIEPLLCLWALPLGLAAIACMPVSPDLAALLLHTGGIGIKWAMDINAWLAALPFASIWTITPNLIEIAGYFIALFLLLRTGKGRLAGLAGAVILALHFTAGLFLGGTSGRHTEVTFLDVGQGNAAVARLSGGQTIMIDCGGSFAPGFDTGERIIGPYLWKERIWRLDALVITHPDKDHYGGGQFILQHFKPEKIWVNGREGETGYQELLALAAKQGIPLIAPRSCDTLLEDRRTRLYCLGMPGLLTDADFHRLRTNNASLVLRLGDGLVSFLFPGDIESTAEQILAQSQEDLASQVLLAAHHGSLTSNTDALLDRVQPDWIVISASQNKEGTYPHPHHLAKWEQRGIQVANTGSSGSLRCISDGRNLHILSLAGGRKNPFRLEPLRLQ